MMSKDNTVETKLSSHMGQVSAVRAALKAVEQLTGGQRFDFELVEREAPQSEGDMIRVRFDRVLRVTKHAPRPLTEAEKRSIIPGLTDEELDAQQGYPFGKEG